MATPVTVIVPAFNARRYLRTAVASLAATRYPQLEVVIVDDGSTDGTWDIARELASTNPGVVALRHADSTNHGEAATRDLGIAHAGGRYVGFLDADDTVFPNRFSISVPILDSRPGVDGVCEATQRVVETGGERRAGFVRERTVFDCEDPEMVLERRLFGGLAWSVNAILLRREALTRVGGFGSDLRYGEDALLWLKLAAACVLVPGSREPVCTYRIHGGNVSSEAVLGTGPTPVNSRVLLRAVQWARTAGVEPNKCALLRVGLRGRLVEDAGCLRAAGQPLAALRLLASACVSVPTVARGLVLRNAVLAGLEAAHLRRCRLPSLANAGALTGDSPFGATGCRRGSSGSRGMRAE
jgi:hypothetical protein